MPTPRTDFLSATLGTSGNDTFNGSGENDTFRFAGNEGDDRIESNSSNYLEVDQIAFDGGISVEDVYATYSGTDLVIGLNTGPGTITVVNDGSDSSNAQRHHINEYVFSDGTVLTREEFLTEIFGTSGDDTFNGSGENDTFRIDFGEGDDRIELNSSNYLEVDRLEFGAGVSPSNVYAEYVGNDLRISHHGMTGSVTVVNDGSDNSNAQRYHINEFAFEDGTVMTREEFLAEVLGTSGDDIHNGSGENDTFSFGFNEGNDQIVSNSSNYLEVDTLEFDAGISLADLTSTREDINGDGVDDLVIRHDSLTGSLSVISAYSTSSSAHRYAVDQFIFEDGTMLTQSEFITATDDPLA